MLLFLFLLAADPPKPSPAWTPNDKEMVVILGSAFIEQEARDGYLETELIRLFPNKDIRVRNLGWSGDTVHCQARAYFGPPQEGFDRLRGHLQMIKPTTVICCYGANESWKGGAGIEGFRKGYEKLIDMIRKATGAKVVLMTPPRFDSVQTSGDRMASWSDNLHAANDRLARYWQEIKYIADSMNVTHWKLEGVSGDFMANGVSWTDIGYENLAKQLFQQLCSTARDVRCDFNGPNITSECAEVLEVRRNGNRLSWTMRLKTLPQPGRLRGMKGVPYERLITLMWIFEERSAATLKIDDKPVIVNRPGVMHVLPLPNTTPDHQQSERLRLAIVKKNSLFFHRWRPANETYLYGFRKHEQGNNGVEPPMFDKLVEQAEAEIAVLKKPVPHKYELIRISR